MRFGCTFANCYHHQQHWAITRQLSASPMGRVEKANRTGQAEKVHESDCRSGPMGFQLCCCCCCSFIHSFAISLSLALGPKLLGSFVGAAAAATSLDHLHPCSFVSLYSFARSLASQLLASQFSSVQCSACPFFFPSFYTTFAVPCSLTHSVR